MCKVPELPAFTQARAFGQFPDLEISDDFGDSMGEEELELWKPTEPLRLERHGPAM
ncbi:hypothetical protein NQ038_07480 [Brevibacterium sp. 50QC2O2]|uniref:hypothetical protein n=1 Tax=Brevibacterium sp. 50QC2O2 TaxID=2968459 RepID=UPI00211C828A|nr:hypothetical protein [Brevibacterium sp. 50QC2O2]MCQ9388486.1 hypothetical protein [Brevibacterium sp. 50QC2O2]